MVKNGVKTVGFIGFNDPYGENWYKVFGALAEKAGISDRRQRALRAHRPERHRPGAEAHRREARRGADRGGRRSRRAAAGDAVRPGLQGPRLPDARRRHRRLHPARQGEGRGHGARRRARCWSSTRFPTPIRSRRSRSATSRAYEKQFGSGPATFGANTYDAGLLLQRAIPVALKAGKPGTEAFRVALRDALEQRARRRRLPGRVQHDADQSQRHGRARARAGRRARTASSGCCARVSAGIAMPQRSGRRHPARRGQRRRASAATSCWRRCADGERRIGVGARCAALAAAVDASSPSCGRATLRCGRCCARAGARVVVCADAAEGMGASLACGVRECGRCPDAQGWVVALADMPWMAPATIARVADALRRGAGIAAPTHRGTRGHPVGFGAAISRELAALSGDEGAQAQRAGRARRRRGRDVDA